MEKCLTGEICQDNEPLVVYANEPNDIAKILNLKIAVEQNITMQATKLSSSSTPLKKSLKLIIAGGIGAWKVASKLASLNVPVLLVPARWYLF